MSKRRLGKGIDALLQGRPLDQLQTLSSIIMVDIDRITPNPNQPRKQFPPDTLNELAESIREKGIIQPIIAEDQGDGTFIIIAGERRYRAARIAGLDEVPVISQDFSEDEKLEIALIENIQREDLNPLDEARALKQAMDVGGLTQEKLAKRLGKSRSAVTNMLRLLKLEPDIQQGLLQGVLTAGHARVVVGLTDPADRLELYNRIKLKSLSVRQTELSVRDGHLLPPGEIADPDETKDDGDSRDPTIRTGDESLEANHDSSSGPATEKKPKPASPELEMIERLLIDHLGTRVVVRGSNAKGQIHITYLSTDDLERIIEAMGVRIDQ